MQTSPDVTRNPPVPRPRRGSAIRILVVDDEPDVCEYLSMLLEKEGYEVVTAVEPLTALETFKGSDFHLVILDIMMPGMDGTAVLQEIRRQDDDVAVIVFTGYPSVDTAVTSLQHQASDYLTKPVRVDALKTAVRRVLAQKGLVVDAEAALLQAVGKKVRALRNGHNLTLRQVARRCGLSVSLISQIERAESSASVSSLHKIATALGVPLTELFEGF